MYTNMNIYIYTYIVRETVAHPLRIGEEGEREVCRRLIEGQGEIEATALEGGEREVIHLREVQVSYP
jgi:hypothetical protein